jgi:molybdopterin converting factor small subunit
MITINFNAFSFLKNKCREKNIECPNKMMKIEENTNLLSFVNSLGFSKDDIEGIFVNHKLVPFDTVLKDGDRVALVPPGGIPNHVRVYVGKTG